jgi:peptidyl-prolyl cis-trans isomerase A (cyclophilin A)
MRAILVTSLTILCLGAQTPEKTTTKAPAKTTPAVAHHKAPMLNPASYKAQAPPTFKAKFTTTKGIFVVEVHRDWAPIGADRFYNLVKGGYFDGGPFYRVRAGFMAQFGFSPNPAVSKVWDKATINDDPVKESNKRGYITYAKTGAPNSRSTHLFINYVDNSFLDGQGFAPFGSVVLGMEVVDKLFSGYGDTDQGKLRDGGAAYVKKDLPDLDLILSAEIMPVGT